MDAITIRNPWDRLSSLFKDRERGAKTASVKKSQNHEPLRMTPELEARIAEAEKNVREGNCVSCRNREELHAFLDSL